MKRFAILLGTALLAYVIFLQFIFPGYVAPPVPYHNDMYWALGFVVNGWSFPFFLHWPRPVFYETLLAAGHLGLEGSLAALTLIVLADLALALALLERFVLKRSIPWWLALCTMLLAMSGPGFYAQPAFDVGYHLALLFGLLGMWVWESQFELRPWAAWTGAAVCFCLSTLSNEGFAPALALYGIFTAARLYRRPVLATAALALPVLAVVVSAVDGRLTHSPFVVFGAAKTYPYRIDLSPHSLLQCTQFYLSGLANPAFACVLAVCIVGLWNNRRLLAGGAFLVGGLALYTPYLLLPNHLDYTYQWPPMPLLMLIVPLAWTQAPVASRPRSTANAALAAILVGAIAFQSTQYAAIKAVYRARLEHNRRILASVRAHATQIAAAHSILLRGLRFANDPWAQNAASVSGIVPFRGEWAVETEPGYPPADEQADAVPVHPGEIGYRRYDLVIDFTKSGDIARVFRPRRITVASVGAMSAQHRSSVHVDPGFYRYVDELTVYRVSASGRACAIVNVQQMAAYGGFSQVETVRHGVDFLARTAPPIHACPWPR